MGCVITDILLNCYIDFIRDEVRENITKFLCMKGCTSIMYVGKDSIEVVFRHVPHRDVDETSGTLGDLTFVTLNWDNVIQDCSLE